MFQNQQKYRLWLTFPRWYYLYLLIESHKSTQTRKLLFMFAYQSKKQYTSNINVHVLVYFLFSVAKVSQNLPVILRTTILLLLLLLTGDHITNRSMIDLRDWVTRKEECENNRTGTYDREKKKIRWKMSLRIYKLAKGQNQLDFMAESIIVLNVCGQKHNFCSIMHTHRWPCFESLSVYKTSVTFKHSPKMIVYNLYLKFWS